MAKSYVNEDEKEVTFFYLKPNSYVYFVKKLRSLAALLIDSIIDATIEKEMMTTT